MDASTQTGEDEIDYEKDNFVDTETDYQQDLMVIKNDYQNRFYELLNNTEVFVQLESVYNIQQPFST